MRGYIKANLDKNGKVISFRIGAPTGKDGVTGKYTYHFETVKTDSKKAADKRLRELLTELDKGTFVKPCKQTVKDYLVQWLSDNEGLNRTYEGYYYNIHKYIIPVIGGIPLTAMKQDHIKKLLKTHLEKGHNRTAQYIFSTLSKSLNDAVSHGVLIHNPIEGVDKPKVERHEFRVLTENEINNLLEELKDSEYYALFFTDLFTGMRRSELLATRWQDADLLSMTISINRSVQHLKNGQTVYKPPKTAKSRRLIDLTPANALVLGEHKNKQEQRRKKLNLPKIAASDLIFSQYNGTPYLPDSITHAWIKIARQMGLKGVRLHDCRHSHATLLLNQDVHPKVVQERLGHATISTTLDIYSHVVPGLQAAAAAGFDKILRVKETKLEKELTAIIK